jgi:thiol-disulfide isomerase/thioredoxin
VLDDTYKYRFKKQYELALKNKPGHKASDFIYTLKNGSSASLLRTKSKLLLLYFFNPECHECKITRGKMIQSAVIGQLEKKGVLRILSVYPDQELSAWTKNYAELPASWINGYDKGSEVQKKAIYDLKAIPTLYLLDENKTVLLRDATVENIEKYLLQLTSLKQKEGVSSRNQPF